MPADTHCRVAQNGATPLLAAVRGSHDVCVKAVLDAGADVNVATTVSERSRAVSRTCTSVTDVCGHVVSVAQDGTTPLYDACERGDAAIVKVLMAAPGVINVNAAKTASAAHMYHRVSRASMCRLLVMS
jgi:ankyrin repeat protein